MTANFMLADAAGSLAAFCLFPLIVVVPGYVAAWALDLLDFRRRSLAFRAALSLPLSIAICPIATYLAGRLGSMALVWGLYGAAWAAFAYLAARRLRSRPELPRRWRGPAAVAAAWVALALLSLIDLQSGDRLYYSVIALDYSVRAAFTHSLATAGIPPANPFYFPGEAVPLRYHYFWLILCSLADRLGGAVVGARQAMIGGTLWCGLALMALTGLYLKLFQPGAPDALRKRTLTAVLLLGATGLDILPILLLLLLYARGALSVVLPSVELWNEKIDGFLSTMLWEPHHLASLIACFTAFLLLWDVTRDSSRGRIARNGAVAGLGLASAAGASVYVALVFGAFLSLWTAAAAWKRWGKETAALALAGATAALAILPYLLDLRVKAGGGAPLAWTVRAFSFGEILARGFGLAGLPRLLLVNLPLVPVNYFLELGAFLFAGLLRWRRWRAGVALQRHEAAGALMIAVTLAICTFVRSGTIGNNDLGWRGFLVAQFVLLLWTADALCAGWPTRADRAALAVLLALGAAGAVYDLAILRAYPWLADRGVLPTIGWMAPDRDFGRRTFAARQAYQAIQAAVPASAVIQFNPDVPMQETTALLYADRQVLGADPTCIAVFGGDPGKCGPIQRRLRPLYARGAGEQAFREACESLPLDVVVAKDTDLVWAEGRSWVWTRPPLFANRYVRAFACPRRGTAYQTRNGMLPGE